MRTDTPQPIQLCDYAPPSHLIDTVDLDVSLDPTETRVVARLAVRPNPESPSAPLRLRGEKLTLESLTLDGEAVAADRFALDDGVLTISNPPGGPFALEIVTTVNPKDNRALSGLYLSNGVYCTQCEAEGFRRITFHPDRPDVLSVYTTRIEADIGAAPVLLSNGNPVEHGQIEGTSRHYAVWHDPHPKPSYLFALVGGRLACREDGFVTASGRKVALRVFVEPGKEDRAGYALESLKRAMAWDETAFGREYDLDVFMIVAVSDFNMGAMENKGLNVFNDKFVLASPETATDTDYAHIEAIIAHEYFHNWTGNRITCRDWFQLCLKEGLTVFRDREFTSDMRSRAVKRIADVRLLRNHQFPEDAGPLAHPVRPASYIEINNFYTATVYEKGAEVIRALKVLIGEAAFAAGMDLYFARHDGEAATVEDFVACMAEASGRDLAQFMRWYTQAGTPQLSVAAAHDAATGRLTLDLAQQTPKTPGQDEKAPLHLPLRLGLVGPDGADLPLVTETEGPLAGDLVELTEARRQIVFTGLAERPVVSINRGFSAPVALSIDQSEAERLFLMAHDGDPFNRWQAGQDAAMALLVAGARRGESPDSAGYAAALGRAAADEDLEPAFRAELLRLPGEVDIARQIARDVDTDAVHGAREALLAAVGTALEGELRGLIDLHRVDGPYSPDPASADRRALVQAARELLAAGRGDDGALAYGWFEEAGNMTDTMGALTILKDRPGEARLRALAAFHDRHKGDAIVIDKWLALQAASSLPDVLAEVRGLTGHSAFTWDNPNRIRALIGTFAMANQVRFNAADGSGYDFVADAVLRLDRVNPQVAARLLGAFKSWRFLDAPRRAAAEATLRRVAGDEGLSKDVYEIATKSLQ